MSEREQMMQISRHWRLNAQRYRLQGVRYENGVVSLQSRPYPINHNEKTQSEEMAGIRATGWPTKVSVEALKKQS